MSQDRFSYSPERHQLELGERVLAEGDLMEICVFGQWIPGHLALDSSGWYLLTFNHIGIRLRPGILARFAEAGAWISHLALERGGELSGGVPR